MLGVEEWFPGEMSQYLEVYNSFQKAARTGYKTW